MARTPPFFGPENCVFEIALVSLVGVGTYEKILRPTQNPTLAGMDPLPVEVTFVPQVERDEQAMQRLTNLLSPLMVII